METARWAELPDLVLYLICKLLAASNPVDFYSFCGVCRSWRAAAKPCEGSLPPLLWNHGHVPPLYNPWDGDGHFLTKYPPSVQLARGRKTRCLGSNHGYLIIDPATTEAGSPFLLNPITGAVCDSFPVAPGLLDPGFVTGALLTDPPTSPDCMLLLLSPDKLYYSRPGDQDHWKSLPVVFPDQEEEAERHWVITDAALLHKGKVHVLTYRWDIVTIDLEAAPAPTVTRSATRGLPLRGHSSLFDFAGHVCIAHFDAATLPPKGPELYRLHPPTMEWVKMESLGGASLLLGARCNPRVDDAARWGSLDAKDRVFYVCWDFLGVTSVEDPSTAITDHPLLRWIQVGFGDCYWVCPSPL